MKTSSDIRQLAFELLLFSFGYAAIMASILTTFGVIALYLGTLI